MQFVLGFLLSFLLIALIVIVFFAGFGMAAWDAERRLKGHQPVDEFWRKRGMKDFTRRPGA